MKRRKKNRKQEPASLWVSARLILVVGFVVVVAIGYLAICGRCENLGQDIKDLEAERELVRVEMQTEQYKWSRLTSPRRFRQILAQHGLEMTWPEDRYVVRLDAERVLPYQQEIARSYDIAQSRDGSRNE